MPRIQDLIPPWHDQAACAVAPWSELNWVMEEGGSAWLGEDVASAAVLAPLLVCSMCPVRGQCLREGLRPIETPRERMLPPGESIDWQYRHHAVALVESQMTRLRQPVWGVWGASLRRERRKVRDLEPEEAARLLEATLPDRLRIRLDAWKANVRLRGRLGSSQTRDGEVLDLLRLRGDPDLEEFEALRPPLKIRRSKRFTVGGRGGPGRGHRSSIGRYAASHGCSYATAWRRLQPS